MDLQLPSNRPLQLGRLLLLKRSSRNSRKNRHYLQVTDDHFAHAAQNPAQQSHATGRGHSQNKESNWPNRPIGGSLRDDAIIG